MKIVFQDLTIEQQNTMKEYFNTNIPKQWLEIRFVPESLYFKDCVSAFNQSTETDFDYFSMKYFEVVGYLISAIVDPADWARNKDVGAKNFCYIDRSWLISDYKSYLQLGYYSEIMEFVTVLALIGQEYHSTVVEYDSPKYKISFLDGLFNTEKAKQIRTMIPKQKILLKKLWEAISSPEPSLELLRLSVKNAADALCFIDPCIYTAIDRSDQFGLRRFLSTL